MEKNSFFLFLVSLILISLGLLILTSASAPLSLLKFGHPFYFLFHQILFGILPALVLGTIIFKINLKKIKKWFFFLFLINLFLLLLVFFPPFKTEIRGSSRWISIGNFSFQPSEFLKLTFILYLASWLEGREKRGDFKTFFFFLLNLAFVSPLLIFQPDISTLGIILAIALSCFFLAKTPLWQTLFCFLIWFLVLLLLIPLAPYRVQRILAFLNPEIDPLGISYHQKQLQISIGSGGIFGKGLFFSEQKFGNIPHSLSDSIFAIFAEEAGFLGATFLIFLYFLLFWQIFKIGISKKEIFSRLICFGILSWFSFQTFLNLGSALNIFPLSGVPLPFLSYGGSHLISELLALSILFKISK